MKDISKQLIVDQGDAFLERLRKKFGHDPLAAIQKKQKPVLAGEMSAATAERALITLKKAFTFGKTYLWVAYEV